MKEKLLETPNASRRPNLAKELGLKEAIGLAVGAMIGGGIFSALGNLAIITGPSAVISFLLGAIIAFLTANSYYRLIHKYPSAGGEFVILRRSFKNPAFGNFMGIFLWLGYSVTIALYAVTFGNYTSTLIYGLTGLDFFSLNNPNLITGKSILSFLSILIFTLINLRGVKESGSIQNLIVLFKVLVLLFVGFLGFIFFNPSKYLPFFNSSDTSILQLGVFSGLGGVIIGSAIIFVSYEGYQVIANTVEEMKNPARDVKIAMYISIIIVAVTYIIATIATFSLIQDTSEIDEVALISAVEFLGSWAVWLIVLGAAASTTSAINATLLGSSRLAYVMADWQAFPKKIAKISKSTKVPWVAILFTSLISFSLTFLPSAEQIAESGSIIFLVIFLTINLSIMKVFPNERNVIAKLASIFIIVYIMLVFYFFFTHIEKSLPALTILIVFVLVVLSWVIINHYLVKKKELDLQDYALAPLEKEKIHEFKINNPIDVDDFFIKLENILLPISGKGFETQTWVTAAGISVKMGAKVTILSFGTMKEDLENVENEMKRFGAKYRIIIRKEKNIAEGIIRAYKEGDYQLICMSSKRRNSRLDRILDRSISKKVVNKVNETILQIHPPIYFARKQEYSDMFLLFDGTQRDIFLANWAKLISLFHAPGTVFVYHITLLPHTISVEDAGNLPEIRRSVKVFEQYVDDICQLLNFEVKPIFLLGHNFRKSLISQIEKYEPDVIFIGHSRDKGIWNKIRTHLPYQLMNDVPTSIVVSHTTNSEEQQRM